jgi:hypothetical protein
LQCESFLTIYSDESKAHGCLSTPGTGVGGGLDLTTGGTVVIDNTTISGNSATTTDNDVHGTFSV